tara:strand:+ start:4326 stop:5378 length:1053 start_codon:yes stop_codon:yes gene_type:complete
MKDNAFYLGVGPSIDLSDATASAHIDTMKVDIFPKTLSCENSVRHTLWRNSTITPDNRKGYRKKSAWAYKIDNKANAFRVTIQDVTQDKLAALHAVFNELGGLNTEPMIYEVHFALDFKIKSKAHREYFAATLPMFVNSNGIDLTGAGTPRIFVGDEVSDYPGFLHLRISTQKPREGEIKADTRPEFYQYNSFLSIPGTTYFGRENGERYIRIYHKIRDKDQPLPEERQIVREEQVFRGNALVDLGITTLESLVNFNTKALPKYFRYEIGQVTATQKLLQTIQLARVKPLMQAGAFAVRESEGGPRPKQSRGRKATVALSPLQKRASNAWRDFAVRWENDRVKAHDKFEA